MKPITTVMDRQGDLGGEEIAMQIDADATAHIMSVLTDLYSDTILAVIREYSTNALDAHIAVGNKRPIEVTTPTAMSPFFKVRDYGVGLDVEDIRNIYSKYGASTKRMSDDFNGVLGLGCKSALTYTNQFTVISVKDGVRTSVSVSRTETGGHMQVVSIVETTEANSTEIAVPTRDLKFETKAKAFFRFWKPGTVLLNGADPTGLGDKAKRIVEGMYMVPDLGEDYVVMGNVAYPVGHDLYKEFRPYGGSFGVVAFVEMGRVSFTPSREKLMMTPKTVDELNRIRRDFKSGLLGEMRRDINDAPTPAEALARYSTWQNAFRSGVPDTYKGTKIPTQFKAVKDPRGNSNYPTFTTFTPGASRYAVRDGIHALGVNEIVKSVVVTEYSGDKVTPAIKEKLYKFLSDNNLSTNLFVFTADDQIGSPWCEPKATVTWETVKAIKVPRPATVRNKKAKYEVICADGRLDECDNITASTILYVSPTEEVLQDRRYGRRGPASNSTRSALVQIFPGATIVNLAANRWDKFKRDYPGAIHVSAYAAKVLREASEALTKDDALWISIDSYSRSSVSLLVPSKIDDPEVKKYVEIAREKSNDRIKKFTAAKEIGRKFRLSTKEVESFENPLNKYPLADSAAISRHPEHVYAYINAIYAGV